MSCRRTSNFASSPHFCNTISTVALAVAAAAAAAADDAAAAAAAAVVIFIIQEYRAALFHDLISVMPTQSLPLLLTILLFFRRRVLLC